MTTTSTATSDVMAKIERKKALRIGIGPLLVNAFFMKASVHKFSIKECGADGVDAALEGFLTGDGPSNVQVIQFKSTSLACVMDQKRNCPPPYMPLSSQDLQAHTQDARTLVMLCNSSARRAVPGPSYSHDKAAQQLRSSC